MRIFAFKNRLFLAYAAMTIVLVALFMVLLITFTASFNRQTELIHQQGVFEGNQAQIESLLEQANLLAMQVASNNEILSAFIQLNEPDNDEGSGDNYFDSNLLDAIRLSSLLEGINGVNAFADRISIFNRYGDYVSAGKLYNTPERVRGSLNDVNRIDATTAEIQASSAHCLLLGFHPDAWSNNPNGMFLTLYRMLSYTDTSTPYGLVAVQIDSSRLNALGFWGEDGNGEYFMIDDRQPDEPRLVYSVEGDLPVETLYPLLIEQLGKAKDKGQNVAQFPHRLAGRDVIMLASRPSPSNWLLIRALPTAALIEPYRGSYVFMVMCSLALLVLLLIVVNYMAERISRPLRSLSQTISGIGLKNLSRPIQQVRYSSTELISLDEAFREMLKRLDKAVAVELQAYLRVLQSQMNPHFLYNMLSVIIASSESAGDERTVSMCMKLTHMLRYVADVKNENVTLADELAHTRNYLDLMKVRYEDLFSYEIVVDPRSEGLLLPRLTVQPLAENCFVHGLTNEPPWHIRVTTHTGLGRWQLRVEDNGVGMTQEQIEALEKRIELYSTDVAGNYQELKLGGMGLINTLLRLRLMFNDPIDYRIWNKPEGGLIIEIGGPVNDSSADC